MTLEQLEEAKRLYGDARALWVRVDQLARGACIAMNKPEARDLQEAMAYLTMVEAILLQIAEPTTAPRPPRFL